MTKKWIFALILTAALIALVSACSGEGDKERKAIRDYISFYTTKIDPAEDRLKDLITAVDSTETQDKIKPVLEMKTLIEDKVKMMKEYKAGSPITANLNNTILILYQIRYRDLGKVANAIKAGVAPDLAIALFKNNEQIDVYNGWCVDLIDTCRKLDVDYAPLKIRK